jgi:CDP-diacylglycerol--glycerol-3-phosphate 3-phosphatidyltransferase
MNIPIILTLIRLLAIPIIMLVYYLPFDWAHPVAAIVFGVAAITDWLDGYLARYWSQTTKLGEFLDPVADKLIVAIGLVMVVGEHLVAFLAIPAAIIVGREIAISALREWMAELGKRTSMAVSFVAKIKTAFQLLALFLLLWTSAQSPFWITIAGSVLLYIAAALTLWSMFAYIKIAWPDLTMSREQQ